MRNLLFVALVFLLGPVVGSFTDSENVRMNFWPDGRLRSVVTVRRAISGELVREGPCRFMREDGSLAVRGNYRDDLRQGRWVWYHPDGREHGRCDYIDDEGGFRGFFPDGRLQIEGRYHGSDRIGTWTDYYPSGRIRLRGDYVRGVREGEWIMLSDSEPPESRSTMFENGQPVGGP